MKYDKVAVGIFLALSAVAVTVFGQGRDGMSQLAKDSGCYVCHAVAARDLTREVPTYGPAFREVARHYRRQADAEDQLTRAILQGTGSRPGDKHWAGKVSGDVMPPNTVEISEADARSLARWILSLGK